MLPLKPPAPKQCLKNIKLINFPIFDDNGEVLDKNSWPSYKGIFNGKDIIIKDLNDISRLSCMVSIKIKSVISWHDHSSEWNIV